MRTLLVGAALISAIGIGASGCSPSIQVVSEGSYRAIITQTYGHPAHTLVVLEKDGQKIAQGEAGSKAVGLCLADAAAPALSSLALGLPAALLRPDQTNVTQVGGGASAITGPTTITNSATGGSGGFSSAGAFASAWNVTNVKVKASGGGWIPPGQQKK